MARKKAEADVFDQAIAAQKDGIVQSLADSFTVPTENTSPESQPRNIDELLTRARDRFASKVQRGAETEAPKPSGPRFTTGISLTDSNSGPKMHLGRSDSPYQDRKTGQRHQAGRMVIRFDEKPEGDLGKIIFNALRERHWDFDKANGNWDLAIDPDKRWQTHAAAEEVFKEIANTLREANGLPPSIDISGRS